MMPTNDATLSQKKNVLPSFIITYLFPTVLTKIAILYFGLNYSAHPGDGYGYGLAASFAFTVVMLTRFVLKYWGQEEL